MACRTLGSRSDEIGREQRRLDDEADCDRKRCRQHEIRKPEGQDRTAIADGRQREHCAAAEPDKRRPRGTGIAGAWLERDHDHPGGRNQDRRSGQQRDFVAEKNEPKQRNLHRLGLDIGVRDDERSFAHRSEHQRGGRDLSERSREHPGPEGRRRRRQVIAGDCDEPEQKKQRERKSEQEAHMGRADRAEVCGQLALHGVTRGLCRRSDQREDGPEHNEVRSRQAAADRISAASGNSMTSPFSLSISRNRSK